MKDRDDAILRPAQAAFLAGLLPPRDALLADMERAAAPTDIPISDPEVGRLLEMLVRVSGARRVVEVGTAIGYGTLLMARGLAHPDGLVVSIDLDPERLATARGFLERGGVLEQVRLIEGPALDRLPGVLADLGGPVDLAYLDAVKAEYRAYVDLLVPALSVGGMIVADNVLWKGWVADPPAEAARDQNTEALRAFDHYLMRHPRLQSLVLPLGDGVALAVKTS